MTQFVSPQNAQALEELRNILQRAHESGDNIAILQALQKERPADIAETLASLDFHLVDKTFRMLLLADVSLCAEVLIELDPALIYQLHSSLNIQEWAWIFKELSDDDMVHILDLLPDEIKDRLLPKLGKEDKRDILERMTYPEDTAGRFMTNEFVAADLEDTVASAIERIRATKDFDPVNLLFIYVTENARLVGMVSLRQLLLSRKTTRLKHIMRRDVTAIDVNLDQEEVAEIVRKHDEVNVPVVNAQGSLLGIITVDDVIDVIDEESAEDFYRIIGSSEDEALAGGNTRKIVLLRLPWIMASFCGSLLVAFIMKFSEQDLFGQRAALIFTFVPLICAMGGNVGVQSSIIMARYLSTGNLNWRDARRSTLKEARVGLSLGLICGILIGIFAFFFWGGLGMLITVLTAMVCAMTTAAATGTIIPICMKRFGIDPALATGPFVTSFNDVVATLVYFSIAFLFLDQVVI